MKLLITHQRVLKKMEWYEREGCNFLKLELQNLKLQKRKLVKRKKKKKKKS